MDSHQSNLELLREILLDPEILKITSSMRCDDDVEILKASLLLQSVLAMFRAMRIEQKNLTASFMKLSDERNELSTENSSLEQRVASLQSDYNVLHSKFENAIKVRDSVIEELNGLKLQLAQKVDERAKSIFLSCLKKNKTTSVLDWMTQMNIEGECTNAIETFQKDKCDDLNQDSPDYIGATPESTKEEKRGKHLISQMHTSKVLKTQDMNCVKISQQTKSSGILPITPVSSKGDYVSSPDEIGCTPDVQNVRKNVQSCFGNVIERQLSSRSKRGVACKLFSVNSERVENAHKEAQVISLDTQELEGNLCPKPVININRIIPETVNPDDFEMETDSICHKAILHNEPESNSPCKTSVKSIADISVDVDFPCTPEKKIKTDVDGSPILGSSRKTYSQKDSSSPQLPDISSPALLTNQQSFKNASRVKKKNRSRIGLLSLDKSKHLTEKGSHHGGKKYKQALLSFEPDKHTLDISQCDEFNGGQRSKDLNEKNDVALLEDKGLKWALAASLKESKKESSRRLSILNDSDATFFEQENTPQKHVQNQSQHDQFKSCIKKDKCNINNTNESYFEPMCASTAKVLSPSKVVDGKICKSPSKNQKSCQLLSSTKKSGDDQTQFNPIWTSTEKDASQNSCLNALLNQLNEEDPPSPLETSFDRLPRKGSPSPPYKYQGGPVRRKVDRANLNAWDCPDCREFNQCAGYNVDDPSTRHLLRKCSRHRSKHPRRPSPEGFWNALCPPTPEPP